MIIRSIAGIGTSWMNPIQVSSRHIAELLAMH